MSGDLTSWPEVDAGAFQPRSLADATFTVPAPDAALVTASRFAPEDRPSLTYVTTDGTVLYRVDHDDTGLPTSPRELAILSTLLEHTLERIRESDLGTARSLAGRGR